MAYAVEAVCVMGVPLDQLPAHIRAQLDTGTPTRPRERRTARGGPIPYRCRCGARFDDYGPAERHAGGEGHTRLEVDMEAWT